MNPSAPSSVPSSSIDGQDGAQVGGRARPASEAAWRPGHALDVRLFPLSNIAHLRQIFVGFHELSRLGLVRLRYSSNGPARFDCRPPNDYDFRSYCLPTEIAGIGVVVYDVHDSALVADELLDRCDIYFKRSYDAAVHGQDARIRPLGLNLFVEGARTSLRGAWRSVRFGRGTRARVTEAMRALNLPQPYAVRPRNVATFPLARPDPRILFQTRVWNPDEFYNASDAERADRRAMNQFRADCIRGLKRVFGERFTGGLQPTPYAREHFPDVLADDRAVRRDRYLQDLQTFDICVSTEGLLGSTGWKFAEYLALGRAVVAEEMRFEATGTLAAGEHYLPFDTVDNCVESVSALAADRERRQAMMTANAAYYREYVEPEALVRRSIVEALIDWR